VLKQTKYLGLIGLLAFIVIWGLMKILFFKHSIFLSTPQETFVRLYELIVNESLLKDFNGTMTKFLSGFGLAVLIGVPAGYLLGINKRLYLASELVLDFFRSIPVTTLFPLFILFYGIGSEAIIAMITVACVFVIILNTAYGVFYVKESYINYLRTIGASKIQIFKHVIFHSSLPFLFVGLRTSVSFALIVVIVAEMFIGSNTGLGRRVYEAHETYLIPDVYAIIVFVGIIGFTLNKLFFMIEKRIIHWK
jgi:ABC-type nitrate/sulfonate/bicarbonate transport system permease component